MQAFRISRLGWQALVVLTAALGVAALHAPSEYWKGVLTMVTAAWMAAGIAQARQAQGVPRLAWMGFVGVAAVSLAFSFGPWSDARQREAWPDPMDWPTQSRAMQPVSRALVSLMPVIRPETRALIQLRERSSGVATRVEVSMPYDRLEGADPLRDEVARLAARLPLPDDPRGASRARQAATLVKSSLTMSDYQAVGHLLAALLLGGLTAVCLALCGTHTAAASSTKRMPDLRPVGGPAR